MGATHKACVITGEASHGDSRGLQKHSMISWSVILRRQVNLALPPMLAKRLHAPVGAPVVELELKWSPSTTVEIAYLMSVELWICGVRTRLTVPNVKFFGIRQTGLGLK